MLIAAAFFVGIQLINLAVNTDIRSGELILPENANLLGGIGAESWIWIPVKAMFFDVPSLGVLLLVSLGGAWFTVEILNRQFVESSQQVLTARRSPVTTAPSTFRQGMAPVFLTKEWRVILRSPYLLSRTLLSVVFLIPLMVWVLYGQSPGGGLDIDSVATIALPTTGAFLTSSLAVICIAGEEAPDLIKSAPVNGQRVRVLKLLAILLPVWSVLAVFFVGLGLRGVEVGVGIGLMLLATICTALIRLWNARPISLSGMMMRRRENAFNDTILGILESLLFFVWIILGTQVRQGNGLIVAIILVFLAGVMAIAYWRSRALGSSLGF
jgi:ABC-2 type transport system permease protein